MNPLVLACGPEAAETVHRLTRAAFAGYGALSPPSGALAETLATVRAELAAGGGALALLVGSPAGCLRLDDPGEQLHVRRVAVEPEFQGRGVGRALMAWAEAEARRRGHRAVLVGVRQALPGNLEFYRRLGYGVAGAHSHPGFDDVTWYSMTKLVG